MAVSGHSCSACASGCAVEGILTELADKRRVVLAGNPNSGKTTLFNALTGMCQRGGNYPGVTVEKKSGRLMGATSVDVVDLPGLNSLSPKSLDERIACEALVDGLPGEDPPDLVVCVVDVTNLERHHFLASQITDLGRPTVVLLNMMDEARKAGLHVDVEALENALGVPVLPGSAAKNEGVARLRHIIMGELPVPSPARRPLPSAAALERASPHIARDATPASQDARSALFRSPID